MTQAPVKSAVFFKSSRPPAAATEVLLPPWTYSNITSVTSPCGNALALNLMVAKLKDICSAVNSVVVKARNFAAPASLSMTGPAANGSVVSTWAMLTTSSTAGSNLIENWAPTMAPTPLGFTRTAKSTVSPEDTVMGCASVVAGSNTISTARFAEGVGWALGGCGLAVGVGAIVAVGGEVGDGVSVAVAVGSGCLVGTGVLIVVGRGVAARSVGAGVGTGVTSPWVAASVGRGVVTRGVDAGERMRVGSGVSVAPGRGDGTAIGVGPLGEAVTSGAVGAGVEVGVSAGLEVGTGVTVAPMVEVDVGVGGGVNVGVGPVVEVEVGEGPAQERAPVAMNTAPTKSRYHVHRDRALDSDGLITSCRLQMEPGHSPSGGTRPSSVPLHSTQ